MKRWAKWHGETVSPARSKDQHGRPPRQLADPDDRPRVDQRERRGVVRRDGDAAGGTDRHRPALDHRGRCRRAHARAYLARRGRRVACRARPRTMARLHSPMSGCRRSPCGLGVPDMDSPSSSDLTAGTADCSVAVGTRRSHGAVSVSSLRSARRGPGRRRPGGQRRGERCTIRTRGSLTRASRAGSRRRPSPCAFWSFLRSLVGSRSPKTVPRVWSVSCWRQRASMPVAGELHRRPVQPEAGDRGAVGPRALDERARVGEAALVALVELAVLALGQLQLGVADHADRALAAVVGAVEDEHGQVHADLAGGQADAVGGVHRLDHVRDQRAELLVVGGHLLLRPVHHRLAPAGDRPDGRRRGGARRRARARCRRTGRPWRRS